ncbi:MAG: 2,3-bisphosphoglycerate-independent phosphoglycerate mutase [Saprospirales bacterium]|nr:MAG: 2,3-bisphosphoglycerate-independent phosphoglycerate mutase [Saprospirales bacterium]
MKKSALIILDGWGLGKPDHTNAIFNANTPFMDGLMAEKKWSKLTTHGESVGLPEGQMGNSEVGHLNIGAGRIVYQDLVKINKAIEAGQLDQDGKIKNAVKRMGLRGGDLHVIGLCSDGGVHSHLNHLHGLCNYLNSICDENYFIHAITDGRDTDPKSGKGFIEEILKFTSNSPAALATICGRYYAMDRDKRWERTKIAYDALVNLQAERTNDEIHWLESNYDRGKTDEFLLPVILDQAVSLGFEGIKDGDTVIFFNFRTDRPRQLTTVLTQQDFPDLSMKKLGLDFITFTRYDEEFTEISVLFEKDNLVNTMGEVLEAAGLSQLRMAETEKYPHVTFFFSGGRESPFTGEERIMATSPKVSTYDLKPEMSAYELTDALIKRLAKGQTPDFICINYANADMVGHTGDFNAAIKAAESVDSCMADLISRLQTLDYEILIIADHGNSDYMINQDGSPNTAHTTNLVPCIYLGEKAEKMELQDGILADVAPSLLFLMGIEVAPEMDGKNLFL